MSVVNSLLARMFPLVPRPIAQRLSARYIAGATTEDALRVAEHLRGRSLMVTLDVLGESVRSPREASKYAIEYEEIIDALDSIGISPHVSVKPSSLGSLYDWKQVEEYAARIAESAAARGGGVCIDMEWAESVDQTLDLYRRLRAAGLENVSAVVQARLHRSRSDLLSLGPLVPSVRICKGIYPESARVAWTDKDAIRRNFVFCLDTLLDTGGHAAIATHDEALIVAALERISHRNGVPPSYEFQMLLGVRNDLAARLSALGHPVRIYVPFGEEWHQYLTRRLRESPHILPHVLQAMGGRLIARLLRRPDDEWLESINAPQIP